MSERPVIYVLAGVNGAGKSSIGGQHLAAAGVSEDDWFNPDAVTRELIALGVEPGEANSQAWTLGRDLLEEAVQLGRSHALETTLGGSTQIMALLKRAAATHDVIVWYCGLDSVDRHVARVAARVARGGHDIPTDKIRYRYEKSQANLIELLPYLRELRVYDNSAEADARVSVPDPLLVLHLAGGELLCPSEQDIANTPEWAMAIVEASLEMLGR